MDSSAANFGAFATSIVITMTVHDTGETIDSNAISITVTPDTLGCTYTGSITKVTSPISFNQAIPG